jgi:hypothetical protein
VIVVLLGESMPNIVQTQGVLILWIVHLNAMITTQLNHYRFFDLAGQYNNFFPFRPSD